MSETVNQEVETTAAEPERTFTQSEMDAIIRDRLKREREKYADYDAYREKAEKFDAAEEAQKSELQKATERAQALQSQLDAYVKAEAVRNIREKISGETGIPASLLSGEDEETCKAQAEALMKWHSESSGYPVIADKGEVTFTGGGKTRDQFAEWLDASLKK